jgi:hypothetical protein
VGLPEPPKGGPGPVFILAISVQATSCQFDRVAKYILSGRNLEAKCRVADDRITFTGFAVLDEGELHVYFWLSQSSTPLSVKPSFVTAASLPKTE